MTSTRKAIAAITLALGCGIASAADTPFNTVGAFFAYTFDSAQAGPRTIFTTDWVQVTGASPPAGTVTLSGQGSVGTGKSAITGVGSFNALSWAGWSDRVVVVPTDPSLMGQTARISFQVNYDWSASVEGAGSGYAFVDMNVLGAPQPTQYSQVAEEINRSCLGAGSCGVISTFAANTEQPTFEGRVATFTFGMVLGQTYQVVVGMNTTAVGDSAMVNIDATHSLSWVGTAAVSVAGQPVDFTIGSQIGFNYATPVDESSTFALMLPGLSLIALLSRRQTRYATAARRRLTSKDRSRVAAI